MAQGNGSTIDVGLGSVQSQILLLLGSKGLVDLGRRSVGGSH